MTRIKKIPLLAGACVCVAWSWWLAVTLGTFGLIELEFHYLPLYCLALLLHLRSIDLLFEVDKLYRPKT